MKERFLGEVAGMLFFPRQRYVKGYLAEVSHSCLENTFSLRCLRNVTKFSRYVFAIRPVEFFIAILI